jgi:peptidyl-prolyl cis-trans isomerase SurA
MKRVVYLLFLILFIVQPVSAKTLTKVAAVVNDDIITTYELDKAVAEALSKNPNRNQMTATRLDELTKQTLKTLVKERLFDQQIKELGIEVSDSELTGAIEDVAEKNGLTKEALYKALKAQGLTMDAYRNKIKKEILRYKLMGREVNYKVLVTTGEIRRYYDEHIKDYNFEPKIHIKRISFPVPQGDEKELAAFHKQVEVARDLLLNGEDFDKVLKGLGDVATGGDMGSLVEADLAKPLQEALVGLKPGDVTEPAELNGQIHLFQVVSRTKASDDPFEQAKPEIEAKLRREKTAKRFEEWQKELRENAHIEIRL